MPKTMLHFSLADDARASNSLSAHIIFIGSIIWVILFNALQPVAGFIIVNSVIIVNSAILFKNFTITNHYFAAFSFN